MIETPTLDRLLGTDPLSALDAGARAEGLGPWCQALSHALRDGPVAPDQARALLSWTDRLADGVGATHAVDLAAALARRGALPASDAAWGPWERRAAARWSIERTHGARVTLSRPDLTGDALDALGRDPEGGDLEVSMIADHLNVEDRTLEYFIAARASYTFLHWACHAPRVLGSPALVTTLFTRVSSDLPTYGLALLPVLVGTDFRRAWRAIGPRDRATALERLSAVQGGLLTADDLEPFLTHSSAAVRLRAIELTALVGPAVPEPVRARRAP